MKEHRFRIELVSLRQVDATQLHALALELGKLTNATVGFLGEAANVVGGHVAGALPAGANARQMVAWARKYGIQSTIHTGGPSIPGSGLIDKDVVLEADADVIGHINGGHTSLPEAHVCELCEKSSRAIEIVHNGNETVECNATTAEILKRHLGANAKDAIDLSTSKKAIERVAGKVAPKGKKAQLARSIFEELREAGTLTRRSDWTEVGLIEAGPDDDCEDNGNEAA